MNYQRIYDSLIERSKDRVLEEYKEKHHIVPRCLGGTNDKNNLVYLTAREHYICHWLLYKIYKSPKLAHAWHRMCYGSSDNIRYTSYTFEYARAAHAKEMSNSLKGVKKSSQHKLSLSNAAKQKTQCVHCLKVMNIGNINRYHNDNCKLVNKELYNIRKQISSTKIREYYNTNKDLIQKRLIDTHNNNPQNVWIITWQNNEFKTIGSLKSLCRENDIPYKPIFYALYKQNTEIDFKNNDAAISASMNKGKYIGLSVNRLPINKI